jgi:hypothetical protein
MIAEHPSSRSFPTNHHGLSAGSDAMHRCRLAPVFQRGRDSQALISGTLSGLVSEAGDERADPQLG